MTKKQEQTEEDLALQDGEKHRLISAAGKGAARKAQQCHSNPRRRAEHPTGSAAEQQHKGH